MLRFVVDVPDLVQNVAVVLRHVKLLQSADAIIEGFSWRDVRQNNGFNEDLGAGPILAISSRPCSN